MSFQPLPNPPTAVVVPEMVPRGTVKTVFNPAADKFAQSLNPFSLYLQDFRAWVQNANQIMSGNMQGVYTATVVARDVAVGSATTATTKAGEALASAESAAASATTATTAATTATTQAGIVTTKAGEALTSANSAASSESNAAGSEEKAEQWAESPEDVPVEPGQFSAKHWATKAANVVSQGVIDDGTTSTLTTWSSQKISDEKTVINNTLTSTATNQALSAAQGKALQDTKQGNLVSGVNIKTINNASLLGNGNLAINLIFRSARTGNMILGVGDSGKLIDITSGTFAQTFSSPATLGNGWWCYIRNSGTGDVTMSPASGGIDGLTSYVMYPGEVRLVQCDGATLRTVVLNSFYKVFTVSGTFTKPPGYSEFKIAAWGGGSSGASSTSYNVITRGGGGGGYSEGSYASSVVGSTVSVVVGAGGHSVSGAASNSRGGNSLFGTLLTANGGSLSNGGYGMGADTSTGRLLGDWGGVSPATGAYQGPSSTNKSRYGGCDAVDDPAYVYPARSLYGAGSGQSLTPTASARPTGISTFGGAGGLAGIYGTNATAGAVPGGGGGAVQHASGTAQSGAGARGELRIWGII